MQDLRRSASWWCANRAPRGQQGAPRSHAALDGEPHADLDRGRQAGYGYGWYPEYLIRDEIDAARSAARAARGRRISPSSTWYCGSATAPARTAAMRYHPRNGRYRPAQGRGRQWNTGTRRGKDATPWVAGTFRSPSPRRASCSVKVHAAGLNRGEFIADTGFPARAPRRRHRSGRRNRRGRRGREGLQAGAASWVRSGRLFRAPPCSRERRDARPEKLRLDHAAGASIATSPPTTCSGRAASESARVAPRRGRDAGVGVASVQLASHRRQSSAPRGRPRS